MMFLRCSTRPRIESSDCIYDKFLPFYLACFTFTSVFFCPVFFKYLNMIKLSSIEIHERHLSKCLNSRSTTMVSKRNVDQ